MTQASRLESQRRWDQVAREKTDADRHFRLTKWKNVARNWLAAYADERAVDLVLTTIVTSTQLGRSARVLDVGCGPGKWSIMLARLFSAVTAVDVSREMIRLAKENAREAFCSNVSFHTMPVSELNLKDESFDLVNCVTVLQHVHDDGEWLRALSEIARVTKRKGNALFFEVAPSMTVIKHTRNLSLRPMRRYVNSLGTMGMHLTYWRAADLSLPVTYFGLRNYAESFSKKVHYFTSEKRSLTPNMLSSLSWTASALARWIDHEVAGTPLGHLALAKVMVFRKDGK